LDLFGFVWIGLECVGLIDLDWPELVWNCLVLVGLTWNG